jgi:putative ABC transport system permease protein
MRIPLIAGRVFEERDGAGQPKSLVINEALARRDFSRSANAVGQQVYVGGDTEPWTIVGVVADVRQFGLNAVAEPQFFLDARQWAEGLSPLFPLSPYYTLRFDGDQSAAIATVESVLKQTEAEGALFNVALMEEIISTTVARPRMYAVLLGVFAVLGVTMALIGTYGVMSYTVSQRTRELGIRMALGARAASVLGLVLRQSLILTAVGVALGLLGAATLTRILETMLFQLTPLDPTTFAGVALLFVLFAGLAAYVPARRATLVDPLVALRTE